MKAGKGRGLGHRERLTLEESKGTSPFEAEGKEEV